MTSINALRIQLEQAKLIEHQQSSMPSDQYIQTLHYIAINTTNKIRLEILNHADLTIDIHDEIFPAVKGDIPYPVSC